MLHRRTFLIQSGSLLTALWNAPFPLRAAPKFSANPYSLGIASGDPDAGGFVLWTRLAPKPLEGGGMPDEAYEVQWEVADDEGMTKIVKRGKSIATPSLAHSVHVEVKGLKPDRWYFYRFISGGEASPVGRTRTTPAESTMAAQLKYAFASCQHWETGYYTAYEHMAAEDPDLVLHLGDYIYEGKTGPAERVRHHPGNEIVSLSDYRNRHALYKTDASMQKMHTRAPWIITWDDHEVDNNYAGDIPEDSQTRQAFLERRANAYQAYYEHMPLRAGAVPKGSKMQLYRNLTWGSLAQFSVLDTRQYRTDQPCGDGRKEPCPATFEPTATILGEAQHSWLEKQLSRSKARWNVIPQQVLVAKVDHKRGAGESLSMDQWSGYEACRKRFLQFLNDKKPSNPVVLTGDIHSHWACDLKLDWADQNSPTVGVELTGTSITSGGDGADESPAAADLYAENPHLKFHSYRRGYVSCRVTPDKMEAHFRTLPYVAKPGAPLQTPRSFVIENGKPGLQKV